MAIRSMTDCAARTGIGAKSMSRHYLWTDAFALMNALALYRETHAPEWRDFAATLIVDVHDVLERHRSDTLAQSWLGVGPRRPVLALPNEMDGCAHAGGRHSRQTAAQGAGGRTRSGDISALPAKIGGRETHWPCLEDERGPVAATCAHDAPDGYVTFRGTGSDAGGVLAQETAILLRLSEGRD